MHILYQGQSVETCCRIVACITWGHNKHSSQLAHCRAGWFSWWIVAPRSNPETLSPNTGDWPQDRKGIRTPKFRSFANIDRHGSFLEQLQGDGPLSKGKGLKIQVKDFKYIAGSGFPYSRPFRWMLDPTQLLWVVRGSLDQSGYCIPIHPWRWRPAGTFHSLEVCFQSCSFLFVGDSVGSQPFIFEGSLLDLQFSMLTGGKTWIFGPQM